MDAFVSLISNTIVKWWDKLPEIIAAVVVLWVARKLGQYAARTLTAIFQQRGAREINASFFNIITSAVFMFLGSILALQILGLEKLAMSVLAGGGVTAVVLGFAFREIGENFLAGIFLAFSRPFKTGDAIKSEEFEGKVTDIALRYTHLRTDDGRDVYIPSSQLFNRPVTNFTKDGLRQVSFSVGIDYRDDAAEACKVLEACIQNTPGVLAAPQSGAYILALAPLTVNIECFYWMDVFDTAHKGHHIRTQVMDRCRALLLSAGYKVSADTSTNVVVHTSNTATNG